MDMGFFIGTADRREPEFEHGAHSSLVREVLPPEFLRSFEGGSPDGGRNTGTKRDRPAFRLPRLSHHNLDAYRQKTQKNTLARVVRFVADGRLIPALDFASAVSVLPSQRGDVKRVG